MTLHFSIPRVAAGFLLAALAACSRPVEQREAPAVTSPMPSASPVIIQHPKKPIPLGTPGKQELGESPKLPEPSR